MEVKQRILRCDSRLGHPLLRTYLSVKGPRISRIPWQGRRTFAFDSRWRFFRSVEAYLQLNRFSGSYLEFGSHTLNTARIALNTLGQHNIPAPVTHFFLFDTFAGMPTPTGVDQQRDLARRNECNLPGKSGTRAQARFIPNDSRAGTLRRYPPSL